MKLIDLRSDTVTRPTAQMRAAMAAAEVGDDVLGEDPTVRELEDRAAELLGKEAGLFVASGTMANQVAAMALCSRGSEVVVTETSHIYNLEVAALSALQGLQARPLPSVRGCISEPLLASAIRAPALQVASTGMVLLENSADLNRGWAVSPASLTAMAAVAHARGVPVYLDGARIFNTAVALRVPARDLARPADAVMFCLSKGLACPVGSLLVGETGFIAAARRHRQCMGGGWRQAGILAAAGLVALSTMIDRLSDDHERARRLARGMSELGFGTDPSLVDTNIVNVEMSAGRSAPAFAELMGREHVRVKVISDTAVRMVTHLDVQDGDIDRAIDVAASIVR